MLEDFDFIYRYEIGKIINNNRSIVGVSNDLEEANKIFEDIVRKYENPDDTVIVYLFDADQGVDINKYDSEYDIC